MWWKTVVELQREAMMRVTAEDCKRCALVTLVSVSFSIYSGHAQINTERHSSAW